jgi:gamma-glutamylcyclotransferase (GGCT)/AIG2-like uncharacterized protein YtfP
LRSHRCEHKLNVFVYGTLLPGEANYHVIAPYVIDSRPGSVRGSLYDYGPYPGLVLDGEGLAAGEWLTVSEEALDPLDELEGYYGPGQDNEYERVYVADAVNPQLSGWVYVWNDSRGCPRIQDGSWRDHARRKGGSSE